MKKLTRKAEKLAALCRLGDVSAMGELAAYFRAQCSPALGALLDRYEAEPDYANEKALEDYWPWHREEETPAMGYMLWKMRAALYREEEETFAPLKYYRRKPYIHWDMLRGTTIDPRKVWASNFLRQMGLSDVPPDHESCEIQACAPRGIYFFRYVSDYIPADAEGFGAEYDWDCVYLDEFFNRLPVKTLAEVPAALKELDRRRELYWRGASPARKYKRRLWPR